MKFVTFLRGGAACVGALHGDETAVADLTEAGIAPDMLALIEGHAAKRDAIITALESGKRVPLEEGMLLAPIPTPRRNIFCVGKNYYEHAVEFGSSGFDSGSVGGNEVPKDPIIFTKPPSAVIGPGAAIESALDPCQSVDYEAELAVVDALARYNHRQRAAFVRELVMASVARCETQSTDKNQAA